MEASLLQFWNDDWFSAIARGAGLTVAVSLGSMLLGLLIGTAGGIIKWKRLFPLMLLVDAYTSLVRGVPELLIIFLLFFGSVQLVTGVSEWLGLGNGIDTVYAFLVGLGAIGFISGAYLVEVIRSALASIPRGHVEAAQAVGLSPWRIFRRIIVPQMVRIAIPGINNVWQSTIKDTALISVVGLQELMRIASIGANTTRQPLLFFMVAGAVYFGITLVSQSLFNHIERLVRVNTRT